MKQRGRKSPLDLSTVVVGARQMPPRPPAELTDAQADVWRSVVASLRGDWMSPAAYPVLIEYCRHVCRARLLQSQIEQFELEWVRTEGGLERFDRLLGMADRETRVITACARALRLTPSAQMDPRSAARRVLDIPDDGKRPWDASWISGGDDSS
jgi:hypothetical protein